MKKLFFLTLITGLMFTAIGASAQVKQKPSPPDTVRGTIKGGVDVTIAYSQPGIKGRTLGKEIATYGKLWRTGANEQTAITFSKDVKIEGNELPAGKYSIWSIPGEDEWVIIINKNTTNWGTNHDEDGDLFKFTVKTQKAKKFAERFKFSVEKSGKISFVWGDALVSFNVKS